MNIVDFQNVIPWSPDANKARPLKKLAFVHLAAVTCCALVTDIDNGSGVQSVINMLFTSLVGSELCLLGLGMAAIVEWPPRRKRISFLLNCMPANENGRLRRPFLNEARVVAGAGFLVVCE